MLLCKQEEAGVQLNAEQADWKDDTDDEFDDQELEAHYMYMAHIQEVTPDIADISGPIFDIESLQKVQNNHDNYNVFAIENEHPEQPESVTDAYREERCDTNITIDSLDMCYDREQDDQDDADGLAQERHLLASLIDKLNVKLMTAKITNQLMFKDLKKFQSELDKYHDVNYALKINDLNQTISDMKKELFANQETISIMSQEKEAQIKFYKSRKDKELDKVIALENKVKVFDDIVYKTGQYVQTMNTLNRNCKTSFAKPEFLKKAQRANPWLYDIGCYNDNLALMLAPESDKMIRLDKEIRSKLSNLIRPFDYDQLNTLYDLFIPQREKSSEQYYFSTTLKMNHTSANKEISKESFRVIPTTRVSRPQLKINQIGDTILPNNSQGKKQEVEGHRRNFKFSNNKTPVTAYNDSLNAKTSNVNFVCVTCGKCVLNDNYDMYVLYYINGVNSRTRQLIVVPISTRETKQTVNQSVATSHKKIVATNSTVKKPRNIIRKIYEQVSKTCSWWYPKFTPPEYKWKPKSPTGKVNPNVSMPLGNTSRTANILEHTTPRRSTISNTPLSSNSFAARRDNSIHLRLWVLKAHDGKSQTSN
ncbi:hypothetical protein Tco_1132699 [Tanacetum coccineum]|uniref:Uncharacterized protein n=1 Tax=Tanacetum coccineum TaxID=301880 RepID=A0ABQ5JFL5_9ASTR